MCPLSDKNRQFFSSMDELFLSLKDFLNAFNRSKILQEFTIDFLKAFFIANLIQLFFDNLTVENANELKLSEVTLEKIKIGYTELRKNVELTFSGYLLIDEQTYKNFRHEIKKNFPDFEKISDGIEEIIDMEYAERYLNKKAVEIKKTGKKDTDCLSNNSIITMMLETFVSSNKYLPRDEDLSKLTESLSKLVPIVTADIKKTLDKDSIAMLKSQRMTTAQYMTHLHNIWKDAIDGLECLIEISVEAGADQTAKLQLLADYDNNLKYSALIKVHSRAIHIANEILVLLKAGYPDGASARWRTLHELSIISFVLYENDPIVSQRYLEHEFVKRYKNAKDYQIECESLGYEPLSKEQLVTIEDHYKEVCQKYADNFELDYGWIPVSILPKRTFREIEKYVKLNKFHPFYNLSCDSVHSGSNGLFRLGIVPEKQNDILLVGPSNYGLADPLQNTAISLGQINACLLGLSPDFRSIISMNLMKLYIDEICKASVEIHQKMERENAGLT